jgi:copper chaperone
MATATLKVKGMTCGHCVKAVTDALHAKAGVSRADVDLIAGRAQVEYDDTRVTPRELAEVVSGEGYEAEELP